MLIKVIRVFYYILWAWHVATSGVFVLIDSGV